MLIPVLMILIGALLLYAGLKGQSPVDIVKSTLQSPKGQVK